MTTTSFRTASMFVFCLPSANRRTNDVAADSFRDGITTQKRAFARNSSGRAAGALAIYSEMNSPVWLDATNKV